MTTILDTLDDLAPDCTAAPEPELVDHPVHGKILNVATTFLPVTRPDGTTYNHTVIRFGSGLLGVSVPRCTIRGITYLGLIEIDRPAVGTTRLEFPRGGVADLGPEEAMRELVEETGLVCEHPRRLGVIQPDSGTVDLHTSVWLATIRPTVDERGAQALPPVGFIDPETGSSFTWMHEASVASAIGSGRVSCGITLASIALLHAVR